jgi:hypothetical protein
MDNNSEYFNTETFSDDESSNMSSSKSSSLSLQHSASGKSSLFKSNPTSFNSFNLILDDENDEILDIFNSDYYKDYKDQNKYMFIKENLQARITSIDKENQTINIIIDDKLEFDKINIINKPLSIQSKCSYQNIINPIVSFQKLKMYDNIIVETRWKIHKLSNEGHCIPLVLDYHVC